MKFVKLLISAIIIRMGVAQPMCDAVMNDLFMKNSFWLVNWSFKKRKTEKWKKRDADTSDPIA